MRYVIAIAIAFSVVITSATGQQVNAGAHDLAGSDLDVSK
jgi:hypothetical protein